LPYASANGKGRKKSRLEPNNLKNQSSFLLQLKRGLSRKEFIKNRNSAEAGFMLQLFRSLNRRALQRRTAFIERYFWFNTRYRERDGHASSRPSARSDIRFVPSSFVFSL
jgi:hypothetical protein